MIIITFLFAPALAVVVADKVLPFLSIANDIATVFCIIVLLPLSIFRTTRTVSIWGFLLSSFLFGLGVWMDGILVTYDLWGRTGVFAGLILGVVGVVPLAIIAAGLNHRWELVGDLVTVFVFGGWSPNVGVLFGQNHRSRASAEIAAQCQPPLYEMPSIAIRAAKERQNGRGTGTQRHYKRRVRASSN